MPSSSTLYSNLQALKIGQHFKLWHEVNRNPIYAFAKELGIKAQCRRYKMDPNYYLVTRVS